MTTWDIFHYNIIKGSEVASKFEIIVYTKSDDSEPVSEFLLSLSPKMQAKVLRQIDMLAEFGNRLREPYSALLEDGIFELRDKQGSDISRVLYFFFIEKKIVLTNGFTKKTQKMPPGQLQLAKTYREDYLKRYKKRSEHDENI